MQLASCLIPQNLRPPDRTFAHLIAFALNPRATCRARTPSVAMHEENPFRREVDQFVLDEIDSVPHLEALLLLWNSRPRQWVSEELAKSLYLQSDSTASLLRDLQDRSLATFDADSWCWNPDSRHAGIMPHVDATYRRELVRISSMIHSKASPAVRQFARAFRLKKD